VRFVDVVIRQAHPGPEVPPYRSFEEKMRDAERFQQEDAIPWTILVDDLEGTVHQQYGGLADPTYLIDPDGRVAYYCMWTQHDSLDRATEALQAQDWRGVVNGGVDQIPHMTPAVLDGWPALQRGLPQSFIDLELASPGAATGSWLGYHLKHMPLPAKVALGAGAIAFLALRARRRAS
jgi:hypothetical protein